MRAPCQKKKKKVAKNPTSVTILLSAILVFRTTIWFFFFFSPQFSIKFALIFFNFPLAPYHLFLICIYTYIYIYKYPLNNLLSRTICIFFSHHTCVPENCTGCCTSPSEEVARSWLFSQATNERMQGNGTRLCQVRRNVEITKNFTERTSRYWDGLPRKAGEPPSLQVFRKRAYSIWKHSLWVNLTVRWMVGLTDMKALQSLLPRTAPRTLQAASDRTHSRKVHRTPTHTR